jgi:hypothetical protein
VRTTKAPQCCLSKKELLYAGHSGGVLQNVTGSNIIAITVQVHNDFVISLMAAAND